MQNPLALTTHHWAYRRLASFLCAATLAAALLACGGGSSGGFASPTPPTNDPGTSLAVPDLGAVALGATASSLPAGWMNGAFMEIYVRGYKDSNGDGKGDLQGLISKLDYLKDLGVTGIWLMPVTDSADKDHGYNVKNYRAIETDYGSMADFDELLTQAHARGMGVIMDYVINHSSNEHPLFKNAASSPLNTQRDFYVWQATKPSGWSIYGKDPWYASPYANGYYFAGFVAGVPDFNLKNAQVETFHHDNLRFWLNKGLDGLRFDAVGNLVENGANAWESQPENHPVMARAQQVVRAYNQRYIVCEAPAASQAFAAPTSCGSAFAFDLKDALVNAARGNTASIQAVSRYFQTAPPTMATLLSNHDSFAGDRLWNQFGGNVAQYKLAAASYLLLPGTPFIYYGEEVGMANGLGLSGDWALRTPMSWTASPSGFSSGTPFRNLATNAATQNVQAQVGQPDSLHSFYKSLLSVRNSLPSIARGSYVAPFVSGQVMGYQRHWGGEKTLVLINYGNSAASVEVTGLGAGASLVPRLNTGASVAVQASGSASVTLPAQSVAVYQIQL
ncbi:MAG: alpha-amylase [Candidatus Saccharibacteria bacterium]|nr:alpha-amylase [Rhodoferax sp.]